MNRDRPELPADIAVLLEHLRDALLARGGVVGVYLYGSLVTGDFSPARSDIDVLVMVEHEPDEATAGKLRELHKALASSDDPAGRLHCLYASAQDAADSARLRTYWYGDLMTQWQVKLLTQAELAAAGVALYGPWPPPGLGPVAVADLQAAVREEITGYWRRVACRRRLWLQDTWVDHGLVTLPRAEALLTSGDLITKSEAIRRLPGFGVPAALADQIRRRRDGQDVALGQLQRIRRAQVARRQMRRGIRRLSSPSAREG
ncbi:MAG: nucleotidyltransferase domain-containing protein [Streptosporangiaceae bacterium]